jgi:prepilin-type N-terminal cleavage/methylation domain-containing protein
MSVFVYRHSRSGFTLVELIVGMTIFAIGLTGILALLGTTISNSSYSRHEIVVAGLLREQMELVKNIRDTNLKNYTEWDKIFVENTATTSWSSGAYIIENNFQDSEFSFGSPPF